MIRNVKSSHHLVLVNNLIWTTFFNLSLNNLQVFCFLFELQPPGLPQVIYRPPGLRSGLV